MLTDDGEHLARLKIPESRPAELLVRASPAVAPFGKQAALHWPLEPHGFEFLDGFEFVEPPQEQEIGDLFDHFERVGDASGPERIPDGVDLAADFPREHREFPMYTDLGREELQDRRRDATRR